MLSPPHRMKSGLTAKEFEDPGEPSFVNIPLDSWFIALSDPTCPYNRCLQYLPVYAKMKLISTGIN